MSADIKALNPNGTTVTKQKLIELGSDPELEDFMMVTFWKDGSCLTCWSEDQQSQQLLYGAEMLKQRVLERVFKDQ